MSSDKSIKSFFPTLSRKFKDSLQILLSNIYFKSHRNKTESKFSPRSRANPFFNPLNFIKNFHNFQTPASFNTYRYYNLPKQILCMCYKIHISIVRFQSHEDVRYISANYKYKFQSSEFKLE